MKFSELELSAAIQSALILCGFDTATEVQEKAIPVILEGRDIVVRSQTGSGKTFAFGLPIIQNIDMDVKSTQALIVCPTRELAVQVTDELRKITRNIEGVKVVPVYGGADIQKQILSLKSNAKIVVGTPGRIMDHIDRRTLKLSSIKYLVLDEADEMLNMGFKDDIEKILATTNVERQTMMFSATFPATILAITQNYQRNALKLEIGEDKKSLASIKQSYVFVGKEQKTDALIALYKKFSPKLSIIFCNTKRMTETLVVKLAAAGITAVALNGDMRQGARKKALDAVKKGSENVLIATDVAARGIDINNVEYIFNYDLPNNVEYYLHRIGRTARAGKEGNSVAVLNTKAQVNILKEYEIETSSEIVYYSMGEAYDAGKSAPRGTVPSRADRREFSFDSRAKRPGEGRGERKPYPKKESGFGGERKSYAQRDGEGSGERKPYVKRDGEGSGERKPYVRRDSESSGERKPYVKRDGEGSGERKPYVRRDSEGSGERKPYVRRDSEGSGERKPYVKRDGEGSGERKPYVRRDSEGSGERKPYPKKEGSFGGERKPFAKKDGEGNGDYKPNIRKIDKKDSHFDPYAKRDRAPRKEGMSETDRRKMTTGDKIERSTDSKKDAGYPRAERKGTDSKKPFGDRGPRGSSSGFGGAKFGGGSRAPKRKG